MELRVWVINDSFVSVKKGDRVAQLVCERICYPDLQELKVKTNKLHMSQLKMMMMMMIFFIIIL